MTRQRQPRVECPAFLAFLRRCPCIVCDARPPVQAAHLRMGCPERDKRPTGMSEKPSDRWATPLCHLCHLDGPYAQHRMGEARFWARVAIDPFAVAETLWAAFLLAGGGVPPVPKARRPRLAVTQITGTVRKGMKVSGALRGTVVFVPHKHKWPSAPLRSEARWPKGRKIRNDR